MNKCDNDVFVSSAIQKVLNIINSKDINYLILYKNIFDKIGIAPAKACVAKYTNNLPNAVEPRMLFFSCLWDCFEIYKARS